MCLTRKFSFGNVARLQCGGEINVLLLKSWMLPVPIVLPHTYHIVHKTCIKKGQALSGRALYTYWCLWLMHSRGLTSARDWNFVFIPFQVFCISFISPTEYVVDQFLVLYFVIKYGVTVLTCSHALHIHPITHTHTHTHTHIYIYTILVSFCTDILSSETTSLVSVNCINCLPQVRQDW